jgi:hypothetical protein
MSVTKYIMIRSRVVNGDVSSSSTVSANVETCCEQPIYRQCPQVVSALDSSTVYRQCPQVVRALR